MEIHCTKIPTQPEWSCVRIRAKESDTRIPIHLCCLIDVSGSMSCDNRLEYVKQSLNYFLNTLDSYDQMSIVTFSYEGKQAMKPMYLNVDAKNIAYSKIGKMEADGGTNLLDAFIKAKDTLLPYSSSIKQCIMLLTDGHATIGHVHPTTIANQVKEILDAFPGTSLSCIGYGTDHNVKLLHELSTMQGGSYYVVNHAQDVPIVFGDILGGVLSCSTQRVNICVENAVEFKSCYPIEYSNDHPIVHIGDLSAGKEAVFLVKAPSDTNIHLKWDSLENGIHEEKMQKIQSSISVENERIDMMHSIRYDVVKTINDILKIEHTTMTQVEKNKFINHIEIFQMLISAKESVYPHSLWTAMKEELKNIEMFLTENDKCCMDFKEIMIQRTACLGMMRGIAASASGHFRLDIPEGLRILPTLSQAYSNSMQHTISSQYYDTFTQDNNYQPPDPILLPPLISSIFTQSDIYYETQPDSEMEEKEPGAP